MTVTCSKCGEELLGSVNRCWRCGTNIVSVAGVVGQPPVRYSPLGASSAANSGAPNGSSTIDADRDQSRQPADAPAENGDDGREQVAPWSSETEADAPVRVGSPFAVDSGPRAPVEDWDQLEAESPEPVVAQPVESPPIRSFEHGPTSSTVIHSPYVDRPAYNQPSIAVAGAITSLILGIMSLLASFISVGAGVTAILGVCMGVWGIYSNKRGLAILGIVLCCIALTISGVRFAVDVHQQFKGYSPFETPPEVME